MWYHALILFYLIYSLDFDGVFFDVVERELSLLSRRRKILRSNQCTTEGVRAGFKGAEIGCVASTVPTLGAVQMIPWAKVNLNYTAQALIISSGIYTTRKKAYFCGQFDSHY
ncbi:hypothetical protein P8452_63941 [Trifolium repens]|nr:hypothetical protein P8452_63941 [Trifolium repens]